MTPLVYRDLILAKQAPVLRSLRKFLAISTATEIGVTLPTDRLIELVNVTAFVYADASSTGIPQGRLDIQMIQPNFNVLPEMLLASSEHNGVGNTALIVGTEVHFRSSLIVAGYQELRAVWLPTVTLPGTHTISISVQFYDLGSLAGTNFALL